MPTVRHLLRVRAQWLATMVLLPAACMQIPAPLSDHAIEVGEGVTLTGLLHDGAAEQLAADKALVIDLRTPEEDGLALEAQQMGAAGVRHVSMPVGRGPLTADTVARFSELLQSRSERRVVVHCASGNRAGMLWAAHLIEQGQSNQRAQREVSHIVTKDGVRKAIAAYVPQRRSPRPAERR